MDEQCKLHEENLNLRLTGIQAHVQALTELHEQSALFQKETLLQIKEQTTKTNGRVTELEKNTMFWTWLSVKPHRLCLALITIIIISKLLTNDILWELLTKII